jgi:hypothetical protein
LEGTVLYKNLLLLQVERPAQQDVRKWKKAALQRDGPHQADQVAPRCRIDEPGLPEALLENDDRMACRVQVKRG